MDQDVKGLEKDDEDGEDLGKDSFELEKDGEVGEGLGLPCSGDGNSVLCQELAVGEVLQDLLHVLRRD